MTRVAGGSPAWGCWQGLVAVAVHAAGYLDLKRTRRRRPRRPEHPATPTPDRCLVAFRQLLSRRRRSSSPGACSFPVPAFSRWAASPPDQTHVLSLSALLVGERVCSALLLPILWSWPTLLIASSAPRRSRRGRGNPGEQAASQVDARDLAALVAGEEAAPAAHPAAGADLLVLVAGQQACRHFATPSAGRRRSGAKVGLTWHHG
jgi:hypothetical protein